MDNLVFKKKINRQIKRMIGFVNQDSGSKTFGCADRNFWHYKLNDYTNARMQEICLSFAFCYKDENSEFYHNEKLLELIKGIIGFWVKARNRNGSVNEIFPHEQSFCATSFSLYIILETIELLDLKDTKEKHKKEFLKTGDWLIKNGNWHIANQIVASALSLKMFAKMYDEKRFSDESSRRLKKVFEDYEKKGYFSEYGGFDLGYTTITMSLLARVYQNDRDEKIYTMLKKEEKKIDGYLDKYARYDNINMSRNTEFIYPFAFKMLESSVLEKIKNGLKEDRILNPDWMDDRYLVGLSNDYLMTYFL